MRSALLGYGNAIRVIAKSYFSVRELVRTGHAVTGDTVLRKRLIYVTLMGLDVTAGSGSVDQLVKCLSDSKMMWNQSKAACEEEGAHLAVVPDSATNDFLKHLINTTYEGFPSSHWIGVKRLKECNYTTIHGFTDWAPGQPVCNYDCVHLWSASNLMWDDTDCKHLFNYICEITFF
ncbi:hepatic lectin-like isoform X2 [Limulus polyphemus]|uniref:Hepatic lectin-like isoform X2 n=1 Tax=Limulus polyphemus TaxID=6850 RepID=A0ABM1SRF6_LIMPO|nr:hepatic lectin-like isoform X2 [Limulus polyphemus]